MGGRGSLLRAPGAPWGCELEADPGVAGLDGDCHGRTHACLGRRPCPNPPCRTRLTLARLRPFCLLQEAQGLPQEVERLALFSDAPEALPAAPQGWAALWRYQGFK